MTTRPADLLPAFHALLDGVLKAEGASAAEADTRRRHLKTFLNHQDCKGADSSRVLRGIKKALNRANRARGESKKKAAEGKRYKKQRQGQRLYAKGLSLLEENLSRTDINWPFLQHAVTVSGTL